MTAISRDQRPSLPCTHTCQPFPFPCAAVLDLGGNPQLLYLSATSSLTFERVHVQGKSIQLLGAVFAVAPCRLL